MAFTILTHLSHNVLSTLGMDGQQGKRSRRLIFTRHVLATLVLVYVSYYIFRVADFSGFHYGYGGDGMDTPEALDYLQAGRDKCRDNLVPWKGPSHFETKANNIQLKVGKGNLATKVDVLTNGKVHHPTIEIHANVTRNRHDD